MSDARVTASDASRGPAEPRAIERITLAGEEAGDMSEDEAETAEPAVELGEGAAVEGQPIGRVASRLTWPAHNSDVIAQEGDSVIRTPDGPRELGPVLEESGVPLFEKRAEFVDAVANVVGDGPVATE